MRKKVICCRCHPRTYGAIQRYCQMFDISPSVFLRWCISLGIRKVYLLSRNLPEYSECSKDVDMAGITAEVEDFETTAKIVALSKHISNGDKADE